MDRDGGKAVEPEARQPEEPGGREAALDGAISLTLRAGGLISIVIVAAGLLLLLASGHSGYPTGTYPQDFASVAAGLPGLKPFAVIDAGLIVLLFTPYLSVAVALRFYAKQRNRLYVGISALVLFVLCLSAALGHVLA